MKSLEVVGRFGFGIVVVLFGVNHFMRASTLTKFVPANFPMPELFVYLTGVAFLAAGVSILINKKTQLAMLLLGIMLLFFALLKYQGGMAGKLDLLKDIGLACAAWFICAHSKD
jgi:uncharacterized membrane protein